MLRVVSSSCLLFPSRPLFFLSRSFSTSLPSAKDTNLFISLGLDPKKAAETAKSPHLANTLKLIATEADVGANGCAREVFSHPQYLLFSFHHTSLLSSVCSILTPIIIQ